MASCVVEIKKRLHCGDAAPQRNQRCHKRRRRDFDEAGGRVRKEASSLAVSCRENQSKRAIPTLLVLSQIEKAIEVLESRREKMGCESTEGKDNRELRVELHRKISGIRCLPDRRDLDCVFQWDLLELLNRLDWTSEPLAFYLLKQGLHEICKEALMREELTGLYNQLSILGWDKQESQLQEMDHKLPVDLLGHVMRFLPIRNLIDARCVCRNWFRVAHNCFKKALRKERNNRLRWARISVL
ncbi:hypothetical protein AAMO2058_001113200 [Amorphochlora amoebiformis]|mmetsp:Transcript_19095/g.30355  ORF Transcript_19095/g.30355 Transcript_19095/m.30355 type:complete len:242 (-) Transcript_19095:389-1114(-)|eukprot:1394320-Amorphochlora_amoeboformis.AAC.1